jgi:hypothetical protein
VRQPRRRNVNTARKGGRQRPHKGQRKHTYDSPCTARRTCTHQKSPPLTGDNARTHNRRRDNARSNTFKLNVAAATIEPTQDTPFASSPSFASSAFCPKHAYSTQRHERNRLSAHPRVPPHRSQGSQQRNRTHSVGKETHLATTQQQTIMPRATHHSANKQTRYAAMQYTKTRPT